MNLLIADSGSTKTSWLSIDAEGRRTEFETLGINPVRDTEEQMLRALPQTSIPNGEGLNTQAPPSPLWGRAGERVQVHFYGAGCIPPYSAVLEDLLRQRFPGAEVRVESDLLGAAQALCADAEGIACILGTGSNSCLYDGRQIVENVSPLGYILGDEGSGAVLGRRLVGDLLKGQTDAQLLRAFQEETGLTAPDIIRKVYREPLPNRFLASLVPFLGRHREDEAVHNLLTDEFRRFFRRNVALYRRPDLEVHFVGGVAHSYRDELQEAARLEGFRLGRILLRPIEGMAQYLLHHA